MSKEASSVVIKAGIGYLIGNMLLKGITFLSAPIFSRLLSTEQFGIYNSYVAYESIIYLIVGLAMHSSLNSAKIKFRDELESYVTSTIAIASMSSALWIVVVNIIYDKIASICGFERYVMNILILHCFASSLYQTYHAYVGLKYQYKMFVKISSIYAISNIVVSVILILSIFDSDRATGRIIGTAIPMMIVAVYILVFFLKKARPKYNKEHWSFALKYSIPVVPHGISQVILSSFDRIMIRNMTSASDAGIYSFAYTIYQIFMVASTSLQNVWKPWMYERMDEQDYQTIRKRGSDYAMGMALFTAIVLVFSPEVIKILGPKEYWDSTKCVVPVVLGGYFAFLYTLPSLVEYFYEKTKYIAIGTTGAAVLNIVLNYYFISKYGYIAAAYTTLVTYILYFVFHYLVARKIHGQSLFATRNLVLISIGIITLGFVTLVLERYIVVRWLFGVLILVIAFVWADKKYNLVSFIKKKLKK